MAGLLHFLAEFMVAIPVGLGLGVYQFFRKKHFFSAREGWFTALGVAVAMSLVMFYVAEERNFSLGKAWFGLLLGYVYLASIGVFLCSSATAVYYKWMAEESESKEAARRAEALEQEKAAKLHPLTEEQQRRLPELTKANSIALMTVANGGGPERGCVVVKVDWRAGERFAPTLYLYRDEGDMQVDVNALLARSTAARLDFETKGRPLRYVDANVQSGRSYNYYAWLQVEIEGLRYVVELSKQSHVVRLVETKVEFAERKVQYHTAAERLRDLPVISKEGDVLRRLRELNAEERIWKATQPAPPPTPRPTLTEHTDRWLSKERARRQQLQAAFEKAARDIAALPDTSEEEKELLLAEAEKEILAEFRRRPE